MLWHLNSQNKTVKVMQLTRQESTQADMLLRTRFALESKSTTTIISQKKRLPQFNKWSTNKATSLENRTHQTCPMTDLRIVIEYFPDI